MLTTITAIADPHYRRELGDGLILRWSTAHDIEDIAYLASSVFRQKADAPLNLQRANLMRELLSGNHPVTGAEDVAVIEDTKRREHPLVCMTFLWRQQWADEQSFG